MIKPIQVSQYFGNFDKKIILPAMQWWDDYIETGVSPEYDEERDKDILYQLRLVKSEEQQEEDNHYNSLYSASGASDMSMYTYLYQDPEHLMGSTY